MHDVLTGRLSSLFINGLATYLSTYQVILGAYPEQGRGLND